MASHIRLLRTNFVFLLYSRPPLLSLAPTPATRYVLQPLSVRPTRISRIINRGNERREERIVMIPRLFDPPSWPNFFISLAKFRSIEGGGDTVGHEFAPLNLRNEFALSIFIRPSAFKFRLVTLTPIFFPIYKKLDTTTRPSLNFDNWSQMKAAGFHLPIVFRYSQERARVQGPLGSDRPFSSSSSSHTFFMRRKYEMERRERERGNYR